MAKYVHHVRQAFVEDMGRTIRQALVDNTPAPDYSRPGNPESTYARNIVTLRGLVQQRKDHGDDPKEIVDYVVANLMPPYKNHVTGQVETLRRAADSDGVVLDALVEAFDTEASRK